MFRAEEQTMSEEKEPQSPKSKQSRASRADAKVFTRSTRRTLKQKPNSDSGETWADILNFNLYEIACHPKSSLSLRLQAIKTVIDVCGDQPIDCAKPKHDDSESKSAKALLRPTPEEEALSDEELDAQIAELQARLGSVPMGSS